MTGVKSVLACACGLFFGEKIVFTVAPAEALSRLSRFVAPIELPPAVCPIERVHAVVGIVGAGKQIRLGLFNSHTKKSAWVELGGTVDGLEVQNYDSVSEVATIKVGARTETLPLVTTFTQQRPLEVEAPVLPAAALASEMLRKPAPAQAEQENEARMLTNDLLEVALERGPTNGERTAIFNKR